MAAWRASIQAKYSLGRSLMLAKLAAMERGMRKVVRVRSQMEMASTPMWRSKPMDWIEAGAVSNWAARGWGWCQSNLARSGRVKRKQRVLMARATERAD